jgi:hypothetical protein|tara:strand:- start:312 stop:476 length:165 start_codon:yes stop_codon:yes gene_type:complete
MGKQQTTNKTTNNKQHLYYVSNYPDEFRAEIMPLDWARQVDNGSKHITATDTRS